MARQVVVCKETELLSAVNRAVCVVACLCPYVLISWCACVMRLRIQKEVITPNFDRIAREGLVFDYAYCNIAVCAPSRNSFMSGLRPDATGIFNFNNHIREPGQPNIVTMPQQFRNLGYTTLGGGMVNILSQFFECFCCAHLPGYCSSFATYGVGKTFHIGLPPNWDETIKGS